MSACRTEVFDCLASDFLQGQTIIDLRQTESTNLSFWKKEKGVVWMSGGRAAET